MRGLGAGKKRNYIRPVVSFLMPSPSHNPSKRIFLTDGLDRLITYFCGFFSPNLGPDQLVPSEALTTTAATGAVKLKIDERGMSSIPPLSVPTLLQRTVARHMDHTALCVKRDGKVIWQLNISYRFIEQFWADSQSRAQSFLMEWAYFRVIRRWHMVDCLAL